MNYIILLLMTILGALGGFFLKLSTRKTSKYIELIKCKEFYLGAMFYCLGALLNIYLLKFIPYNIVMPLNALTYIWAFILGAWIFKEKITKNKIIGIVFIIIGVVFLNVS